MPATTAEKLTATTKANIEALTEGGNAAISGFQELAKAYQALATKNAEKLTASIQALAAVKSPDEFVSLQQSLIKEAVDAAMADSKEIADLTTKVFSTAFEPVKKQVEAVQKQAMGK